MENIQLHTILFYNCTFSGIASVFVCKINILCMPMLITVARNLLFLKIGTDKKILFKLSCSLSKQLMDLQLKCSSHTFFIAWQPFMKKNHHFPLGHIIDFWCKFAKFVLNAWLLKVVSCNNLVHVSGQQQCHNNKMINLKFLKALKSWFIKVWTYLKRKIFHEAVPMILKANMCSYYQIF